MLVIQMPDDDKKRKEARRAMWRGIFYLVPFPLIMWALFAAQQLWVALLVVLYEAWWIWVTWTYSAETRRKYRR